MYLQRHDYAVYICIFSNLCLVCFYGLESNGRNCSMICLILLSAYVGVYYMLSCCQMNPEEDVR